MVESDSATRTKNSQNSSTANVPQEPTSLNDWGVSESVSRIFQPFFDSGKLKFSEFDDRAIDAFKSLSTRDAEDITAFFEASDLTHISNKSAHLCTSIRLVRDRRKNNIILTNNEIYKPDEEKMKAIIQRTGYPYERTSGQRKFGPPPNIGEVPAANGHEIYIGSIPYSVCEDVLIPMMEKCGTIYDLRMMVDATTGRNKGFCFVTFVEDGAVDKAVKMYNGVELKPGIKIRVNPSIPNLKLSVSNLPVDKSSEQVLEEFGRYLDGVTSLEMVTQGECVLHFDRHKNASSARRKLFTGRVRPFDQLVLVDWFTLPEDGTEEDVKVLFVRNIDPDMTDAEYSLVFGKYGTVIRINRFINHLFVHYGDRKSAERALERMDKKYVGSREVEVSFARCQTKKERREKQQIRSTGVPPFFDSSMYFPNTMGGFYPVVQSEVPSFPYYYYVPIAPDNYWYYDGCGIPMVGHFYDYYGYPYPQSKPEEQNGGSKHNGSEATNGGVEAVTEDLKKL